MIEAPVKMLLIFIDQTDTWQNSPLHEAIVRVVEQHGLAGVDEDPTARVFDDVRVDRMVQPSTDAGRM